MKDLLAICLTPLCIDHAMILDSPFYRFLFYLLAFDVIYPSRSLFPLFVVSTRVRLRGIYVREYDRLAYGYEVD